jgi:type VI secretion system protein ImpE
MTPQEQIQERLRAGDLTGALSSLKAAIRQNPADPDLRFLLYQLQSLAGDWTAAQSQLTTWQKLSGEVSPFAALLEGLVKAEVAREEVFAGRRQPLILGEPPAWMPALVLSLEALAGGRAEDALALRAQAMEAASALPGTLNGEPFTWLMDGDSRLGPVFEVILHGAYYWVPQDRVRSLTLTPPEQPRDLVWAMAELSLEGGATLSAHLPARYPGASTWSGEPLKLAAQTQWESPAEGLYLGRGQKVWLTDSADFNLLGSQTLTFTPADAGL